MGRCRDIAKGCISASYVFVKQDLTSTESCISLVVQNTLAYRVFTLKRLAKQAARSYVIRSCAWHSAHTATTQCRPNHFRCQNPTTDRQQLLVRKKSYIMVYIRQDKLPKLKEYKYSGVDHSLLSQYVLKPFYSNVVIKCFPMWMA
jgi:hypothetical protein